MVMLAASKLDSAPIRVLIQSSEGGLVWVAVQVRPNYEKTVAAHFHATAQEHFLPLYRSRQRWSDRVKEVYRPLFPGYLFCRYARQNRTGILSTNGVVRIVGYGGDPAPVADEQIVAIRRIIRAPLFCAPLANIPEAASVRITTGPLKGLEGRLLARNSKKQRFIVGLTLLQRAVEVELDGDWLTPI